MCKTRFCIVAKENTILRDFINLLNHFFMNKKLLNSLLATVFAVVGIFAFSSQASAAVKGDVNGDGECTGSDVTALYNHILFGQDTEIFNGDQNGDGEVTGSDVTAVYNIILGLAPQYDSVYILGEVNGNLWDPSVGFEMATEDGKIYTAHVTTKASGFSYFSFTKQLAQENSETAWDEIAPYRFGAQNEGVEYNYVVTEAVLGTSIALTNDNFSALQVAPGTFDLSIDMEKMELIITGEFTPQTQPEGNWYLIGTNNNWSETDQSYMFTRSTEDPNVYSIHVDNVNGDFWFKIANADCYTATNFWSGTILSAANDGENALSGNLVQGNQGAFCIPGSYKATYLDITINVAELTYSIETDGQEPVEDPNAEYDYMYIAGDADGWSGNGGKIASVKGENDFYGFFTSGTKFKFQKEQGSWAVNYGGSNGTLASNGADIPASGYVYVNANLNNMTYSVTPITSMGVIGDATQGGWATETPLTYNAETNTWEGTMTFTAGEIKFRANNNWDISFGGALDDLTLGGSNITVEAGTYNVALKLVCPGEYSATLTPAN